MSKKCLFYSLSYLICKIEFRVGERVEELSEKANQALKHRRVKENIGAENKIQRGDLI